MDHVQNIHVGLHLGPSGDDHGHHRALDDIPEGVYVAGVAALDDISTEFHGDPGGMGDRIWIEGVLDLGATGVGHDNEGHPPLAALSGDHSEV